MSSANRELLSLQEVEDVAEQIRQALAPLPDGYRIEVDAPSRQVLVCGPTLGFALTALEINDGLAIAHALGAFPDLQKAEDNAAPAGEVQQH